MADRTATIEYVANETDLWCLTCGLNIGARVWYTLAWDDDAEPTLRSGTFCTEGGYTHHVEQP